MHTSQAIYRELCAAITSYDGDALHRRVLLPWIQANRNEREWLLSFASRRGSPIPPAGVEELWRLYALSRVNQLLLSSFQHGSAAGHFRGADVSQDQYVGFFEAMGLAVRQESSFSPFHHEIVTVDYATNDLDPLEVESSSWPCLMLGDMLFSRAGVRVRGGSRVVNKGIAESSTLYWAYRRKNRPYQDQSHGWGSNSQWRTSFRRDYRFAEDLHYNVDARRDLAIVEPSAEDELTLAEQLELLTHRCFITTSKPHDDLYPYDYRLTTACSRT